MKFMSYYTKTDLAQALGIGDSRGDFLMFEAVGYLGCPANASEECKKLVKEKREYISPFNFAKGVADVIKHFVREG